MGKEVKCFLMVVVSAAVALAFGVPTLVSLAIWWDRYLRYRLGL